MEKEIHRFILENYFGVPDHEFKRRLEAFYARHGVKLPETTAEETYATRAGLGAIAMAAKIEEALRRDRP